MKTRIKIIVVIIISLLMLVGGLFFAINSRKETIQYFYDSGYVINNTYDASKVETNKEYFESNIAYQSGTHDDFSFRNTDGKKVTVSEESFVHYSNGSIMALKDGVAIDLEKIDLEILNYYNISDGSILSKKDSTYQINNLDDTITFNKMLFKISDSKYLLAADNIVISFSDGQTISTENFIEIEYANKDVIRLYNDKVNYQTISSNLYILSDNIKIDVAYKTVSKNDVDCLAMVNMVINANDNIEVVEKKEEEKEETDDSQSGVTPGGSGGSGGGTGSIGGNDLGTQNGGDSGNQSGNDAGDSGSDETIEIPSIINPGASLEQEEETVFTQPKFNVASLDVSLMGVAFSIEYVDPSEVLYEDRTVEIVENATGETFALDMWPEEMVTYSAAKNDLKPNNAYTINVRGKYMVDGEEFDRVFVSKIFRTKDFGIEIATDYVAADDIKYIVRRLESSNVGGFYYKIFKGSKYSDESVICDGRVGFDNGQSSVILPGVDGEDNCTNKEFDSNTKYTLYIDKFLYRNVEMETEDNSKMSYSLKTLKKTELNNIKLDYELNWSNNTLALNTNKLQDVNGGIKNYTYKVYNSVGSNLLLTRTVDNDKGITIDIDELMRLGAKSVNFEVEVRFDDNEKTIIYRSGLSEVIELGEVPYPKVAGFNKMEDIDLETISGVLLLNDDETFIAQHEISEYKIVLKERTDPNAYTGSYDGNVIYDTDTYKQVYEQIGNFTTDMKTTHVLPINFKNIIPGRSYDLYVYINYLGTYLYLGYEKIDIPKPEAIDFVAENQGVGDDVFKFELKTKDDNSSLALLDYIELELYCCENETNCDPTGYKRQIRDNNELTKITQKECNEDSTECNYAPLEISSSQFEITDDKGHTIAFVDDNVDPLKKYKVIAKGYGLSGRYLIELNLKDSDNNLFQLKVDTPDPAVSMSVEELSKEILNVKDEEIDSSTIVGYKLKFETYENLKKEKISEVKYVIYELKEPTDTCDEATIIGEVIDGDYKFSVVKGKGAEIKGKVESTGDFANSQYIDVGQYGGDSSIQRGKSYCIAYSGAFEDKDSQTKQISYTKVRYKLINPSRQKVKVSGYLSEYDITEDETKTPFINFKLKVNDIDNTGNIYLYDASNNKIDAMIELEIEDGKATGWTIYEFELNSATSYGKFKLMIDQTIKSKIGEGQSELTQTSNEIKTSVLYEAKLGSIIDTLETDEYNYEFSDAPGRINLTISGVANVDKVAGIEFDGVKIPINVNENVISATINLSDISQSGHGISKNGSTVTIKPSKIHLIYDSGRIKSNNDEYYFVTQNDNDNRYWDKATNTFSDIYFSTTKENLHKFPEKIDDNDIVVFKDPYDWQIGYLYRYTDSITNNSNSFRAHYHEQTRSQIETDTTVTKTLEVTDVVSTGEIDITYDISNSKIGFNFDVNNFNDETQTLELYVCEKAVNDSNKVACLTDTTTPYVISTKYDTDTKKFKAYTELSLSEDKQYLYTIKYKNNNDNVVEITYNNHTTINNENIVFSSKLKQLEIDMDNSNFKYQNGEWKFDDYLEGKNNIVFNQYLSLYLNVSKNFINGTLDLYVKLLKNNNSVKEARCATINGLDNLSDGSKKTNVKCDIDLSDVLNSESVNTELNYKISLVTKNGKEVLGSTVMDTFKITKTTPTAKISSTGKNSNFSIEMSDNYGTLVDCFSNYTGNNLSFAANSNYQMVYDSLYSRGNSKDGFSIATLLNSSNLYEFDNTIYDSLTDNAKNKMYYLVVARSSYSDLTKNPIIFSAIPFTKRTMSIDYTEALKPYASADDNTYRAYLMYCTQGSGDNIAVHATTLTFENENNTDLDVSMGYSNYSITININNLTDNELLSNVKYIRYQMYYTDDTADSVYNEEDLGNISRNVNFTILQDSMGSYTLTLTLPVPVGKEGKDVKYAPIQFLNANKELIRHIDYEIR